MGGLRFDAHYYAHSCGQPYCRNEQWLRFFDGVADAVVREMAPRRVLDAGCALGLLVEALRQRGVEAFGVDVSDYAIGQVHEPVKPYCRVGSIAADLDGHYDLIVCIEVLEHMPPVEAEAAIDRFAQHTDDVLFSSSPRDYTEATHVNVRAPEEWAEAFARRGFFRDADFDASFITAWAVRFRKRHISAPRLVREYERAFARADLERNELRAQALNFDRQVQAEAAEAPRLRTELTRVNEELRAAQQALAEARDRIAHMERSWFWRVRDVWISIASLVGRPRQGGGR